MEIVSIEPFLHYFGSVRERTMRVARCIPADQIDWTYAPEKFTLGDILRHLAVAERYMWAENAQGHPAPSTTHAKELANRFEKLLAFIDPPHPASLALSSNLRTPAP